MGFDRIESYLDTLKRELRRQGVGSDRILEEARGHLSDAVEAGLARGLSRENAERLALARFGAADRLAVDFALERRYLVDYILAILSLALGGCIYYIDSRPTWDDTGITIFAILLASGLMGLLGPRRPWLWAILVSGWFPVAYILFRRPPDFGMLVVLVIGLVGAYAGMAVRKVAEKVFQAA